MPERAEPPLTEIACIDEARHATALLDPLRLDLVARLRKPRSTTELASELGLPRQKVLYHLNALYRAGCLRKAGRRRSRGFHGQRWVASAVRYVVAPHVLGPLQAEPAAMSARLGAQYLLAHAAELASDVARAHGEATAQKKHLATLTLDAEVCFENAAQRERFATALRAAITRVVAEHASPALRDDGSPAAGRPYRLLACAWPVPASARTPFGKRAVGSQARGDDGLGEDQP